MYAAGAGKGRSSGGTPWGRSRQSDGLGRSQDVPGSGALPQLPLRGRAARSFHQCRARRIADFERQIGATLFTRDAHGTRLTAEGSQVVSAVERMEAASFELVRAGRSVTDVLAGEIRIAVPEGLGTSWLAPRLVEFQQAFPNILVDMNCITRPADLSRHEADIAIHLAQPAAPGIERIRLGRMHLMLFASQQYLDTYGVPKTTDELVEHRLVMPAADQSAAREAKAYLAAALPASCR
jgi:DNA-binding transcriptional LysR family regulator